MTGVDIIGELLLAYGPLLAEVPAERIKAGKLPANTPLPALLVKTTSNIERPFLKDGPTISAVDRVTVTVRAASYDDQLRILDLATAACRNRRGAIAGAAKVSVRTAGRGPDLSGPGDSFEQAQDFRVSFNRPNPRGE